MRRGLSKRAESGSGPSYGELRGLSAGSLPQPMLRLRDGTVVVQGSALTTGGSLPDSRACLGQMG